MCAGQSVCMSVCECLCVHVSLCGARVMCACVYARVCECVCEKKVWVCMWACLRVSLSV